MTSSRLLSFVAPCLGLALAGYAACSESSTEGRGSDAGADTESGPDATIDGPEDAGGDADAAPPWGTLPPWDPVWHEKTLHAWPEVAHDDLDCGPGCTVLTAYPPHPFIPFSLDGNRLAYNTLHDSSGTLTLFVDLTTLNEFLIDDGLSEPVLAGESGCDTGIPSVSGDLVLYEIICTSHTRLLLRSLVNGESKSVMIFGPLSDGAPARTGLTPTHAYWYYGNQKGPNSVSSFDLTTGEVKTTTAGVSTCRTTWVRAGPQGDVVLCTNEDAQSVVLIDIANGTATPVSKSQYAQNHGYLSPDGTEVVWLDYRDPGPNGEHGSYDFEFAGEIYWKSLGTGEERRLTFDNPGDPVKKAWPSIRNGIVTWEDWRTLADKNPQGGPGFSLLAAPVRYQTDLDAGAQDLGPADVFYPQATDSGVIALWGGFYPDGGKRSALVRFAWP